MLNPHKKEKVEKNKEKNYRKKGSFLISDDLNFNLSQVLAFPLVSSGQPFNFTKMGLQSFGILIEIECFIVLHGFEFLFLIKTFNQFQDILSFFVLHIDVIVLDGI